MSGFSVVISASDKTAGAIDGINRRLASIRAPAERVQKSLSKFGQLTGISGITKGISAVGKSAEAAAGSITRVIEPLAAITSVASVAGVYRLVTAWGQFGTTLGSTAGRIGISVSNLYALQGAAGAVGASAEAMSSSMEGLSQSVYDAISGKNATAAALFSQLGIAFQDSTRHALPLVGTLHKIADQVKRLMDKGDPRAAVSVMGAFGIDASLLPMLQKGGDALDQYMAKSREYGDMTKQQVKDANDLREAQFWLGRAVDGATNQISAAVGPAITPLINQLSEYIKNRRPEINAFASEKATEFEKWVDGGGLKRLERDFEDVGHRADAVAQYLGGWKAVTEDIIGLMTARFAISFLRPFAEVGLGVARLISSMRVLRAVSMAASAAEAVATAPATATVGVLGAGAVVVGGFAYNALTETSEDRDLDAKRHFRAGRPGSSVYPSVAAPNTAQQAATERALYAEAIRLGDTPAQGVAWLSQAKRESSYNPNAVNAGHYGLFQWDPDRQANFLKYTGHSIVGSSPIEQLDFAHHEVATAYPKARDALAQNRDYAPGAALGLQDYFEMPGDPQIEARKSVDYARDIQARIPQITIPPVTLPPGSGSAGAPGATGKVDVTIRTDGNAKVTASASGNVNPPKIARPGFGGEPNYVRDGY